MTEHWSNIVKNATNAVTVIDNVERAMPLFN